ncbi:MAG: bifunctional diaminohydroxyphosphoribosylaminopyrimidine deaminase/5-amino-6-(5-phosphoribosylamino)uracil reductase RibD [Bacteroidota bacterium]|nr:bifunctional diaminohydroxyphosphoribosylaminopyrimidine deaminase/5-amino-6-(5-phosphoribosylamino)uracil reductase RibD [Bacteroidota bacterium]
MSNFTAVSDHIKYMERCFEIAEKGRGQVAPNPLVGSVIVENARPGDPPDSYRDGRKKIIGEGYHQKYGEAHAEVNAIASLPENYDFTNCTLYVNLEPCSHYGKTPPCSDLIVSKKFKTVVVCNLDSNPLVAGKGLEKLRNAGIEVISGILEKEGRELNKRFFTFHEKKRPYIILKWAQTKDGFISKLSIPSDKEENWITSPESKILVHKWRAEEQAILVGTNTVLNDNPELTTRLVEGKDPIRIVIDRELKITSSAKVFANKGQCIVYTEKQKSDFDNIRFRTISFGEGFTQRLLTDLHSLNIQSLIIEGGSQTLNSFITKGLWDEARVFVGDKLFDEGVKAPEFDLSSIESQIIGTDKLYWKQNS